MVPLQVVKALQGSDSFFYSTSFLRIADVVLIKGQKRICALLNIGRYIPMRASKSSARSTRLTGKTSSARPRP